MIRPMLRRPCAALLVLAFASSGCASKIGSYVAGGVLTGVGGVTCASSSYAAATLKSVDVEPNGGLIALAVLGAAMAISGIVLLVNGAAIDRREKKEASRTPRPMTPRPRLPDLVDRKYWQDRSRHRWEARRVRTTKVLTQCDADEITLLKVPALEAVRGWLARCEISGLQFNCYEVSATEVACSAAIPTETEPEPVDVKRATTATVSEPPPPPKPKRPPRKVFQADE